MNKTVELVNLWGDFEKAHPEANIDDFCRYVLINRREKESRRPLVGGVVPFQANGLLLKIIGRIHKLNMAYAGKALEGTGLTQIEEFGMLLSIQQYKNPKKTEIIYSNIMELSSGADMLTRLKKKGLITEYADKEDKRSRRVKITPVGEKMIEKCVQRVMKLAGMMLLDMPEDDKLLCIKLLKNVEMKFSALLQGHKTKKFDEIYNQVLNAKKAEAF